MEQTVGERIKVLRDHYNLSIAVFASTSGLTGPSVYRYESGKTKRPHKNVLVKIISTYNTTFQWLLLGEGEMLPNGKRIFSFDEASQDLTFKKPTQMEENVAESLKSKNVFLEGQVERLWQLLAYFIRSSNHVAANDNPDIKKSYPITGQMLK